MGLKTAEIQAIADAAVAASSSWFLGAQRAQVAAVIPPLTLYPGIEFHRLVIPTGINKLIAMRIWAVAQDDVATAGPQLQNYNGVAYRNSAGVLSVFALNLFQGYVGFAQGVAPPGIADTGLETALGLVVDPPDDLVINAVNNTANPGTLIATIEWVVLDSLTPIT